MNDDQPRLSLLPVNSSPLERALDLGFARLLERIDPPFPELMNPLGTPLGFLPYLAADRGVGEWDAEASDLEKRLTISLSWQIQRQAGTRQALNHAVESMGFVPHVTAWYEQQPSAHPYTFDVHAVIGRSWSSGDHNRLIRRINAAKSERDQATITLVHQTRGSLALASASHGALSEAELFLCGALPSLDFDARLISTGFFQPYTINDYDLRAQP
ncbi:phage tail protein I [Pseudomonas sp. SWRI102]|uniref:Phage tail protein I n=1 Tax=Pseudomonas marvdashtae TaxID=2745500 RepID=A0A923FR56_9PSED|nr:phage tail protein I [Pseudomonas marvdashtae]MBV4553969.1 phage tail protein I [Pseudomonas marvdashtae]